MAVTDIVELLGVLLSIVGLAMYAPTGRGLGFVIFCLGMLLALGAMAIDLVLSL